MKAMSDKLKGKLWILLGAFVTYIPLVYWRFTEGEKSLFEQSSFFPHYYVMLLLAVCAVGLQCLIASKFTEQNSYHLLAHVSGAVILLTYVLLVIVGMFFLNKETEEEIIRLKRYKANKSHGVFPMNLMFMVDLRVLTEECF